MSLRLFVFGKDSRYSPLAQIHSSTMVATFSPHRDSGGTLHLSHPGMHHVDAGSAIRQLRRSLSRSPSKSSNFSLLASRNHSPSKTTPYIASPLSPSRRLGHGNFVLVPSSHQSPLAVPYPPSAKISRPAMRRTRTSPRSPAKRALSLSNDHGNATPHRPGPVPLGDENLPATPGTPAPISQTDGTSDGLCTNGASTCVEPVLAPRPTLSRIEKRRSGTFGSYATVSPLKRSDGIMNLDQASRGSPSAKRRSVHAANFTPDFSIFDNENTASTAGESTTPDSTRELDLESVTGTSSPASSPFATIPKRSSSLRRSTLQQRQSDRSLFARSKLSAAESPEVPGSVSPATIRPRMSIDNNLFQHNHENLFSPKPPSGSALFLSNPNVAGQSRPAAHPLSRTITQSSSGSSLGDDSPTHEPIHKGQRPKALFNFSKSLPVGASRPGTTRQLSREDSTSSAESFATPENYKSVKPLPAAFMSTGLISKKNRNAEDPQHTLSFSKNMPDTPCKRPTNIFPPVQNPPLEKPLEKPKLVRHSGFVAPSPFNTHSGSPRPGPFARGMGIFGNSFNKPDTPRRGSIVSVDGDECVQSHSPSAHDDSQPLTECDLPPTPTKQTFFPSRTYPPATSQIPSLERLAEAKATSGKWLVAICILVRWVLIYFTSEPKERQIPAIITTHAS